MKSTSVHQQPFMVGRSNETYRLVKTERMWIKVCALTSLLAATGCDIDRSPSETERFDSTDHLPGLSASADANGIWTENGYRSREVDGELNDGYSVEVIMHNGFSLFRELYDDDQTVGYAYGTYDISAGRVMGDFHSSHGTLATVSTFSADFVGISENVELLIHDVYQNITTVSLQFREELNRRQVPMNLREGTWYKFFGTTTLHVEERLTYAFLSAESESGCKYSGGISASNEWPAIVGITFGAEGCPVSLDGYHLNGEYAGFVFPNKDEDDDGLELTIISVRNDLDPHWLLHWQLHR